MGYRNDCDKHKHVPNRTIQKTTTPGTFYIVNGQEARLAFPCWYKEINPPAYAQHHCRDLHDHVGWPSPDHPDHSCQDHDFAYVRHFGCRDASHRHGIGSHHESSVTRGNVAYDHCGDYVSLQNLHPIHLLAEGYKDITVQVGDTKSGLAAQGWIDEGEDWIVRVLFKAMISDLDKPYVTRLAVRASNEKLNKIDTVFLGRLVVLPSAMTTLPKI